MSKFLQLAKQTSTRVKPARRKASHQPSVTLLNLIVLGLLLVTGVGYLVQVNGAVAKGYAIREMETKISQLQAQGSELKLSALELESMQNVQAKVDQLGMVAVGDLDYLTPTPVAVAR